MPPWSGKCNYISSWSTFVFSKEKSTEIIYFSQNAERSKVRMTKWWFCLKRIYLMDLLSLHIITIYHNTILIKSNNCIILSKTSKGAFYRGKISSFCQQSSRISCCWPEGTVLVKMKNGKNDTHLDFLSSLLIMLFFVERRREATQKRKRGEGFSWLCDIYLDFISKESRWCFRKNKTSRTMRRSIKVEGPSQEYRSSSLERE